jgi:hypothetical protein
MRRIFISYASSDREFVQELARSLDARGGKASFSEHGLGVESDWLADLRNRLEKSDTVVLVMPSLTAASSNNAFFEVGAARAIGKDVVIVVRDIDTVDRTNIPLDLARMVVVDAGKQPIEQVAATVMGAVESKV